MDLFENMEKKIRILSILYQLLVGNQVSVAKLAEKYQVSTKSINRDISIIRNFLAENRDIVGDMTLEYNKTNNSYAFTKKELLQPEQILLIIKILSGSRAVECKELTELMENLFVYSSGEEQGVLKEITQNEIEHYHSITITEGNIAKKIWKLEESIRGHQIIKIIYKRLDKSIVERELYPISVVFSDHYFYLLACRADMRDSSVIYYRIDRIKDMNIKNETFHMKFQEQMKYAEANLYSQKMFMGERITLRLLYTGPSLQAILDLFPNCRIKNETNQGVEILTEVEYSKGTIMTLLSQGAWIQVLGPQKVLEDMKNEIEKMQKMYMERGKI